MLLDILLSELSIIYSIPDENSKKWSIHFYSIKESSLGRFDDATRIMVNSFVILNSPCLPILSPLMRNASWLGRKSGKHWVWMRGIKWDIKPEEEESEEIPRWMGSELINYSIKSRYSAHVSSSVSSGSKLGIISSREMDAHSPWTDWKWVNSTQMDWNWSLANDAKGSPR